MDVLPIHKREYHAFISHSSRDKTAFVEPLSKWFSEIAGIPVWYDRRSLSAGQSFTSEIADAITRSRSMIVVLSKASVSSPWVKREYEFAIQQQTQYAEFKIIPVVIDDCDIPRPLETFNHIRVQTPELEIEHYDLLLKSLYYDDSDVHFNLVKDIYVSRTWRDSEALIANTICRSFVSAGFRLIGDAEDQPHFQDMDRRVDEIISSCGGLLSILPYRSDKPEDGYTSKYILKEIDIARFRRLPFIVLAEKNVLVPDYVKQEAVFSIQSDDTIDISQSQYIRRAIESIRDSYIRDHSQHYIFYATNFDNPVRNDLVRRTVQRITGMRCVIGEDIQVSAYQSVQEEIVQYIRKAFYVLADISGENINTLIEAGMARGAKIPYSLLSAGTRQRPPFMFRDSQVFFYTDSIDLLGIVHRLVYPYRRRVINNELDTLN
jgi:hypothetical protein